MREGLVLRTQGVQGPGSLRVGRYIGRLGVVSLPAVQAGLDLDQRVVRRHVARLETAGWLARAPWVWGQGSVVWLTAAGMERAGLGGVRAVKSPPAPTTISHGVLIGWSAARAEHRNLPWKSARELALEPERWAVPMRRERGFVQEQPDLAVWIPRHTAPGAVIAEHGGRREDRQKMILEGWRDAVRSGHYTAVRYDCASPSVAHWITRLASKVGLTDREFVAYEQTTAEHIAAMPSAVPDDEPATKPAEPSEEREPTPEQQAETAAPAPAPTARATVEIRPPIPPPPEPETPEVAASADGAAANSSASKNPSPAADGAANADLLDISARHRRLPPSGS